MKVYILATFILLIFTAIFGYLKNRIRAYNELLESLRLDCLDFMSIQSKKGLTSRHKEYIDVFELIFFPILENRVLIIISFWKSADPESWISEENLNHLKNRNVPRATQKYDPIQASKKW